MAMSIGSVSQSDELKRLQQLQALQGTSGTDDSDDSSSTSSVSSSVSMSKPAEEMAKLASLQKSDPAKFKEVTAAIAQQLTDAASSQTGSASDRLKDLASKFQQASDSGDMASLQPPAHHHHGGGGHKAAAAAAAYAQNSTPTSQGADAVKSAMDSAFDLIDQATGSTASASV